MKSVYCTLRSESTAGAAEHCVNDGRAEKATGSRVFGAFRPRLLAGSSLFIPHDSFSALRQRFDSNENLRV